MKTISVDEATHQLLKNFCRKHEISYSEFVRLSLDYFRQINASPKEKPLSIHDEMKRIEKRLSQVVAFQVEFEKNHLIPLVEHIRSTVKPLASNSIEHAPTPVMVRAMVINGIHDYITTQPDTIKHLILLGLQEFFEKYSRVSRGQSNNNSNNNSNNPYFRR